MPYRIEQFARGEFYHVYNRGLLKQRIFFDDRDYFRFLEKLAKYLEKYEFRLHVYSLMPNHFHLLVEQRGEYTLTQLMNGLMNSYAQFFNKKYVRKGNVFEGRFKAKLIDSDEYMLQVSKYIHRNCGEAGLVKYLLDYPWSSYRSYLSDVCEPFVHREFILEYFTGGNLQLSYQKFVEEKFAPEQLIMISEGLIDIEED